MKEERFYVVDVTNDGSGDFLFAGTASSTAVIEGEDFDYSVVIVGSSNVTPRIVNATRFDDFGYLRAKVLPEIRKTWPNASIRFASIRLEDVQ